MTSLPDPRPRTDSLCVGCRHVRVVDSAKGSRFLRCEVARSDPRLPKYPPQPVQACLAYERGDS